MNRQWINKQTEINISQFDQSMELNYPESKIYMRDSKEHISRLCEQCNYLDAVKILDWDTYLKQGGSVLDLGCGGGWFSAYLSKFDAVNKIYSVDSSNYFITEMLPKVIELMDGCPDKIEPIEGLFTPLLFEESFLDTVVVSSALHHADNLEVTLKEIRRVLKINGFCIIANEVPSTHFRHVYSMTKEFVKIFYNMLVKKYKSISPYISSNGHLNNPYLGDKDYPVWYWVEAIRRSGFELVEIVDSSLPTVKNVKGEHLTHFVCKAV